MKPYFITLLSLLFFGIHSVHAQPPTRPVISHEAPASVVAGQPLRIVARVNSPDSINEVNMHLAQTGGSAPTELALRPAGAGVYSVVVDPDQFAGVDSFRYYLDARTDRGAFSETDWVSVKVIGGSAVPEASKESSWKRPVLIGAGAVVAVGAGVAIAGSGGGGGDGDSGGDGGDGSDPADQVIVKTASDNVNDDVAVFPRVNVVDVAADLGGRSIRRVRVQMNFNAVDGGADDYEVSYNGAAIMVGSTAASTSEQVDVVGASETQVIIQVVDSVPVDGTFKYNWNATVTFFVE